MAKKRQRRTESEAPPPPPKRTAEHFVIERVKAFKECKQAIEETLKKLQVGSCLWVKDFLIFLLPLFSNSVILKHPMKSNWKGPLASKCSLFHLNMFALSFFLTY